MSESQSPAQSLLSLARRGMDTVQRTLPLANSAIAKLPFLQRLVAEHASPFGTDVSSGQGGAQRERRPMRTSFPGDPRDAFIERVASGLTFVDVGGLWGTVNEKVSVASRHGASAVTMSDICPLDHQLWADFDAHITKLGVKNVGRMSGDIQQLAEQPNPPQFDVVHCSGILYHLPNPLQLFIALRKLSRRYLILSSSVTPTRIQNHAGTLEVPQGGALYIPALSGREREIVRAHWLPHCGSAAIGITSAVDNWDPTDFSPWWWLPTAECLLAMGESTGFVCLDDGPSWGGLAHTLLLEVR